MPVTKAIAYHVGATMTIDKNSFHNIETCFWQDKGRLNIHARDKVLAYFERVRMNIEKIVVKH